jgi:hypothetical protein
LKYCATLNQGTLRGRYESHAKSRQGFGNTSHRVRSSWSADRLGSVRGFGGIVGLIQHDNDPDAAEVAPILGAVGGLVLVVLLALSVPGIVAGVGLLSFQPWARILTIVLSILDLVNIPFGTALGVYGLWVLFTAEGAQLFEQRPSMQYQR